MDINLPLPKKQHSFESVDNIDRISKLPDEILAKILNYLSTKRAVATSILSKRWEFLWTLTSDLDFSDPLLADCKDENDRMMKMRSFRKYVDRVIFYHGGSNIRKCSLYFHTNFVSSVYSWICALIDCNLQKLSLHCIKGGLGTYYQLPWRLFSCNTLVVLNIYGSFILDVPKYVCFPRLKRLYIQFALFVDDASMERLFSSCPVLEDLAIVRRKDFLEIMNISVPSLKRLCLHSIVCSILQIKINTPRLEHLETDAKCRYVVNFTSSLVHANLEGLDIYLLNAIYQVESLFLVANDTILQNIIRDSALPLFKNLKTLKLDVGCDSPIDSKVLPNLLDSSPNLQVLIFPRGLVSVNIMPADFLHFNWQRPESVPECLSVNLKTIEIFQFVGFPEELQLVEYLLECGEVLEKLIIHRFNIRKCPLMKMKVKRDRALSKLLRRRRRYSPSEVMSFERSSSTCEVIITD